MGEFELVVFDWDGTLMDSEQRIVDCLKAAGDELGLAARSRDQMRNVIGLGLKEALHTLYPECDDACQDRLVEAYRNHFLDDQRPASEMFAGATQLLHSLRERGFQLAIATGKARRGLDHVLDETGLASLFHTSRCADETRSKPHPAMLQDIMTELRVDPNKVVMVGDTEYDIQMAHNAGTRAVAVSYGVHSKERLQACEPRWCVDSMLELSRLFLGPQSQPAAAG